MCSRGSLTPWLSEGVLSEWSTVSIRKKVVCKKTYSNSITQCCLLLKMIYRLQFRQTVGFVSSLFGLLKMNDLLIPDYSTLCRRQQLLPLDCTLERIFCRHRFHRFESIYGRFANMVYLNVVLWRKLHVCIDLNTQEILSVKLASNDEDDASVRNVMLKDNISHIERFSGDGAYDDFGFREVLGSAVTQVIPPPKNAVIKKGAKKKTLPDFLKQRNEAVEYIQELGMPDSYKIA